MTVLDLLRHTAGFTYGFHNRTAIDAAYRRLRIAEMDTEGGLAGHDRPTGNAAAGIFAGRGLDLFGGDDVVGYLVELVIAASPMPILCGRKSWRR